jgi:hypothetical protein
VRPAPSWYEPREPRPAALATRQCAPGSRYVPAGNPRYESIFDARPGYPAMVAALSWVLGGAAFGAVAVGSAVLAAFLVGAAALALGMRARAAGLAVAVFLLLPTGLYDTRIGPEGLVCVGGLLGLLGAVLGVVHGRARLGGATLAAGLVLLVAVKEPSAIALAVPLALACGGLAVWGPAHRRRASVAMAAVSALGALAASMTAILAGWPGLAATLQDLFTAHFLRPDVTDPYARLLRLDRRLPVALLRRDAVLPVLVVAAVVAGWRLLRLGAGGVLVLALGVSGALSLLVHPVLSEAARLVSPLWIALALGLGALADLGTAGRPARRPARAET